MESDKPEPNVCVLLVEDDAATRSALRHLLAAEGYKTAEAATVAEAHAKLDGQHVVLLDLNLPDGYGSEVLERIRRECRPMKVAVITGTNDNDLLSQVSRLKPDAFFGKPLNIQRLTAWLTEACRSV